MQLKLRTLANTPEALINSKVVLYRSPYDIETKMVNGKYELVDDSRIIATLDTLRYLLKKNCKIVVMTWVGRPDGKIVEELKTKPHALALEKLLGMRVKYIPECVGESVQRAISQMRPKDILMLENTRFHAEETEDDDAFAKLLTTNLDFIVFDAFPQAHRAHSSTTGILRHLPSCTGFYLESEVKALEGLLNNPKHPFTLIIGGSKVSDKVDAVKNLYLLVDKILLGGGSANVFLKAQGNNMGSSLIEQPAIDKDGELDWVKISKQIMNDDSEHKILLPTDLVIGDNPKTQKIVRTVKTDVNDKINVPKDKMALDIGSDTIAKYIQIINTSETIFWAGPMGVFENPLFSAGTKAIAKAISESKAETIVAGGDTIEAVKLFASTKKIKHVSLAGGATLEFLAGKKLPALGQLAI